MSLELVNAIHQALSPECAGPVTHIGSGWICHCGFEKLDGGPPCMRFRGLVVVHFLAPLPLIRPVVPYVNLPTRKSAEPLGPVK